MLHKAGYKIIFIVLILLVLLNIGLKMLLPSLIYGVLAFASLVFFGLVLQFFRNPKRKIPELNDDLIYAPADGKVVVIEEVEENEYFNE